MACMLRFFFSFLLLHGKEDTSRLMATYYYTRSVKQPQTAKKLLALRFVGIHLSTGQREY